jgi:hypothetical protein
LEHSEKVNILSFFSMVLRVYPYLKFNKHSWYKAVYWATQLSWIDTYLWFALTFATLDKRKNIFLTFLSWRRKSRYYANLSHRASCVELTS